MTPAPAEAVRSIRGAAAEGKKNMKSRGLPKGRLFLKRRDVRDETLENH